MNDEREHEHVGWFVDVDPMEVPVWLNVSDSRGTWLVGDELLDWMDAHPRTVAIAVKFRATLKNLREKGYKVAR
jgi:hypothetical protein